MEDDEEIRSHSMPPVAVDAGDNNNDDDEYDRESSSSSSSLRSQGRITVISSISQPPQPAASISPSRSSIREATTVITPPSHCSVTLLALPIQNPQPTHSTGKTSNNASGGSSGGREDCWSEGATAVLIEAWGERFMQLSRGNLKQKHWQEVAEIVSARDGHWRFPKTDVQCKNRIDTVKKKYKSEKSKISSGAAVSSNWRFFDQLDSLIALSASPTLSPLGKQRVPVGIPVGRPIHHHHLTSLPKHKPISSFSSPDDYNQRNIYGVGPCDNKQRSKRPIIVGSTESPDSNDGHPPVAYVASLKKARTELRPHGGGGSAEGGGGEGKVLNGRKTEKGWGSWERSVRELTRAILRFREVYEQAEEDKLHQMVEMEEQRMKFAKELELQRMKFLMKTQMDLSRLRHGSGVNVEIAASGSGKGRGGGVNVNHHSKIHRKIHDKNRDDDNRNYNNINKNDSSN